MSIYQVSIDNYIEKNKDQLINEIQNVVRIKSTIGNEIEMQKYIAKLYEDIGLAVDTVKPDYDKVASHPAFVDSGITFANRENIIGIYNGSGGGKTLTLHGHVDVVSPEPVEKWSRDPWGAEIDGNKLFGRGSADMKAGLIANWFALKTVLDLNIPIKGQVQLHSVIEEEAGGGGGALACMENGYITDGFISTEPHNLNITVAHAGIMYFRVIVHGQTAHAGLAHKGVNAISKMYKIYNALEKLDEKRANEVYFDLFAKGSGQSVHLNRGTLHAGDWVSNVAGKATLECRIGFIPGETREDIKILINDTINEAVKNDEWFIENPPELEWFGWSTEAWNQDSTHPYVQSLIETASNVLNKEVNVIGRASGNDARFTQYYQKPGVCFGPRGSNIHGPDEYVEIDSVIDVSKVLANHITDWTC